MFDYSVLNATLEAYKNELICMVKSINVCVDSTVCFHKNLSVVKRYNNLSAEFYDMKKQRDKIVDRLVRVSVIDGLNYLNKCVSDNTLHPDLREEIKKVLVCCNYIKG